MHIFIDESGNFVEGSEWGLVCSLCLPHREVGPTRREIIFRSRDWPKQDGEIKGGLLGSAHLDNLTEILFRHDALMHVCAIHVAGQDFSQIDNHRASQCEKMTVHLGPDHHPNLVGEVWKLRKTLESMPSQLYLQCRALSELVSIVTEEASNYFAQRRPKELARFEWSIDAKDPNKITSQEQWWKDTLGPLLESRSMHTPLGFCKDFNFSYFDKEYEFSKEQWYPDRPRELVRGIDIKKILSDAVSFKDSRSDILLQAVDVLSNHCRRLVSGKINDDVTAKYLGRLQIRRRMGGPKGRLQTLRILSLTPRRSIPLPKNLGRNLDIMANNARAMLR